MINAIDFFDKFSKEFASQYTTKLDFKIRYQIWHQHISDILKDLSRESIIMDIGCGDGILSRFVAEAGYKVIGVDESKEMIKLARRNSKGVKNISFIFRSLPSKMKRYYNQVDLIICSSVLEFIEDIDSVLQELNSMLKQGGYLLISMPNYYSFYRFMERMMKDTYMARNSYLKYQKHQFKLAIFKKLCQQYGFQYMEHEYYSSPPYIQKLFGNINNPFISTMFIIKLQKMGSQS